VYEDCRRDAEVKIGSEVLDALAPPLSLLLTSVRWMTYNLASMYRKAFHSAYAELVRKTGTPVVNAADFWVKIDPLLYNSKTRIADRILPEFQRKWADVFALAGGATQFDFTCEHLRPKVEEAFAAPYPGWSAARYNSPDIMIAAAGPAALQNGDFTLIVGELHLAINCINGSLFVAQHAEPQEIHDAIMSDFPLPSIVPAPPKNWPGLTARTCFGFISPAAYRLLVSSETCGIPASHAVPISSLVVEQDDDGELVLRTRDNRFRFEIVEGFGGLLADLIVNHFNVLPPVPHSPRITIDRVIVTRETWRFSPSELAFAEENESCGRFLGARRWQQQFGLPRFLFVKSPVERKPFYLDLESPVLVDIFAKVVRRTKKDAHASPLIAISEMVPDCENLWLQDAEGRLYTSEIRMVTLDMTEVPSKP